MNELTIQAQVKINRDKVHEWEMLARTVPQVELKVIHRFSYGVYARELHIPKGVILTGEIHKFENLNILSKGSMLVSTEDGMQIVDAPFTVVSPPGTKRIAKTLSDCVWTTIHGTFETDIEQIKNYFIATDEQDWLMHSGQLELGFG